jgi:hypothetical protein
MRKLRDSQLCCGERCPDSGKSYEAALRARAPRRPDQRVIASLAISIRSGWADNLLGRQASERENVTVRWGECRRAKNIKNRTSMWSATIAGLRVTKRKRDERALIRLFI